MIAAIYARKSTEQHGVSDEEKSVTRQIEHGKEYATQKGWTVATEHIYSDDGISGAEFVKRPGLARLLNSLTPRPPFQALIMMEESRLGREQIETAYVLKRIADAGVRVFFYANDQERRLDSALDKVMLSLANFAAEMEREKASQRTHEVMLRKAKAGHVLGGKVYGYDNVDVWGDVGPDGNPVRKCVQRRINPTEAAIVRRIFEQYASGVGLARLAKQLNAEHVSPREAVVEGGRRAPFGKCCAGNSTVAWCCGIAPRRSSRQVPGDSGAARRQTGSRCLSQTCKSCLMTSGTPFKSG